MDHAYKRLRDNMDFLHSVAEGRRVAHVWESPLYPGEPVSIQYRWPDVPIDPHKDHGIPADFAERIGLRYADTMSRDEAARRLAKMRLAAQDVLSGPSIA